MVSFDRSPVKLCILAVILIQIYASPPPVRDLQYNLSANPVCHLQSIIVTQHHTKNCWRYLNKYWGIFFHWKPPLAKCLLICLADFYRRISDHCDDAEVTIQRCFQFWRGTFAEISNVERFICVIWKDLWWTTDSYRLLKYRGGCTIPLFQISLWCENGVATRHYADICKQLLNVNNRNGVPWKS